MNVLGLHSVRCRAVPEFLINQKGGVMKVTAQFFYGACYTSPSGVDVEHFDRLSDVLDTLYCRYTDNRRYPCLDNCEALIFVGHLDDVTDVYPAYTAYFGPKGAVRVDRL